MKITIRKGTEADLPAILDLVRELAIYEKEPDAVTASLKDYENDFKNIFETIVAEVEGKIAGMALYYLTFSTWKGRMLYLEDFVLTQSHRRHGIGQLIFDALLEEARKKEVRLIKWQVLDWNTPAIEFYKKNKATLETGWWNGKIFIT